MAKQLKEIEIPFGAKDSELKGWEYTIPEGMEAEIKDGKIIVKEKESEDERIRKWLICTLKSLNNSPVQIDGAYKMMLPAIAWLEKQGEQKPAAWSEEDEQYIIDTLNLLSFGCSSHSIGEVKDFLNSLKDRYTWKPTKEQLTELRCVISGCSYDIEPLVELEKELKAL